jgi:phage baseplate assembly protein W
VVEFRSISFPFRISPTTGGVETASYSDDGKVDLIRQGIIQVVMTNLGERVHEKYFGTDLNILIFDPNDEVTTTVIRQAILQALSLFEPRITVQSVVITPAEDEGKLQIYINYVVNRISLEDNFSFLL